MSHSGFPHTTVTLALTHNNCDSRLFIKLASTFYQGGGAGKNLKPITLGVDYTLGKSEYKNVSGSVVHDKINSSMCASMALSCYFSCCIPVGRETTDRLFLSDFILDDGIKV